MEFALALAAKGKFTAKPNPVVGCVIVNNNEIVGQGYHQKRQMLYFQKFSNK